MATLIYRIVDAVIVFREITGQAPTIVLLGEVERQELHGFETIAGLQIVGVMLDSFMQVSRL